MSEQLSLLPEIEPGDLVKISIGQSPTDRRHTDELSVLGAPFDTPLRKSVAGKDRWVFFAASRNTRSSRTLYAIDPAHIIEIVKGGAQ